MGRILIADDDPAIADVLRTICEMDGHEVRTTGDVAGAVSAFIDFDPELMILDRIFKPGGGAEEILAKLARLGGTRGCLVLIVTGGTPKEAAALSAMECVKHVICKPFDLTHLRNTIRSLFGMPPVAPPAPRPSAAAADEPSPDEPAEGGA